jgi:M6 family metalloprotease-like protein
MKTHLENMGRMKTLPRYDYAGKRALGLYALIVIAAFVLPIRMTAQDTQCAGFTSDDPITPKFGTVKVGVLVVSFAYKPDSIPTNLAGWGPKNGTVIQYKYRYQDYWNLMFQDGGPVRHPDSGDVPAQYSANGVDFFTPGSVREYFKENSSGRYVIEPGHTKGTRTGIINPVLGDTTMLETITLPKWDTDYQSIDSIALDALRVADSLYRHNPSHYVDIAGGDFDNIVILFAGHNRWTYATTGWYPFGDSVRLGWLCTAERYNPDEGLSRMSFTYMSIIAHEYAHLLNLQDHYISALNKRVTNQFDLMGWNSPLSRYAPPHLNPLDKVQLGWADVVFASSGRQENLALPIMEEQYNGGKPYLLAVPLTSQWRDSCALPCDAGKFLLVENRRARNQRFGMKMNRFSDTSNYNQASGSGGFLIWRYRNLTPLQPWYHWNYTVVEADGGYHMTQPNGTHGDPGDFFSGREFASWTSPGLFEWPSELESTMGLPSVDRLSGNVYLKFPPYSDSTNVNTIDVVSVDRPCSNAENALEGNNQIKYLHSSTSGSDYMVSTIKDSANADGGMVIALQSTDLGATWPTSRLLSNIGFNGVERTVDVAGFPSMDLMDGIPYTVWSVQRPGGTYDIMGQHGITEQDSASLIATAIACDPPGPRPLVAAYAVGQTDHLDVLFEASDSLRYLRSTDAGVTWDRSVNGPAVSNDLKLTMQIRDQNSSSMCGLAAFATDSAIRVLDLSDMTQYQLPTVVGATMSDSPCLSMRPDPTATTKTQRCHHAWVTTSYKTIYLAFVTEIAHWVGKLENADTAHVTHVFETDTIHTLPDMYSRPVIRANAITGDSLSAAMIWNANSGGGPRIMYAEFKYDNRAKAHRWPTRFESVLGSYYAHPNPVLTEYADGFRFMVEEDWNRPLQYYNQYGPVLFARMKLADDIIGQGVWYKMAEHVEMTARDAAERSPWATLKIGQPSVVESYEVEASYLFDGIRDEGYNGTAFGPIVDSLSHSELISLHQGQVILFDVNFRKHRTNGETVQITAKMYDDLTQGVISASGPHIVWSTTTDTIFTVGLELPYGFDSAHAHSFVSISGGDFDNPERYMTIQRHYYSERMPIEKRVPRPGRSATSNAALSMWPTIAGDRIQVKYRAPESGTSVLTVFDALGRTMHREQLSHGTQPIYRTIGIHGWPRGMYFCVILYRGIPETVKFVVR